MTFIFRMPPHYYMQTLLIFISEYDDIRYDACITEPSLPLDMISFDESLHDVHLVANDLFCSEILCLLESEVCCPLNLADFHFQCQAVNQFLSQASTLPTLQWCFILRNLKEKKHILKFRR